MEPSPQARLLGAAVWSLACCPMEAYLPAILARISRAVQLVALAHATLQAARLSTTPAGRVFGWTYVTEGAPNKPLAFFTALSLTLVESVPSVALNDSRSESAVPLRRIFLVVTALLWAAANYAGLCGGYSSQTAGERVFGARALCVDVDDDGAHAGTASAAVCAPGNPATGPPSECDREQRALHPDDGGAEKKDASSETAPEEDSDFVHVLPDVGASDE